MLNRFSFVVLFAVYFFCLSCQPQQDKKPDQSVVVNPRDTGLAAMEQKLGKDSLNIQLRMLVASNYYSGGILDKAAFHFLKIIEQDNKNLAALTNLGNICYDSRQDDKAIEFYERALEIDSTNINMRCDLATCYLNINRLKKAIQLLKENCKMDPLHAKSHYNLSVILKKNGDHKEADQEMKIYQSLTDSSNSIR